MSEMTLNDYQREAMRTAEGGRDGDLGLTCMALGIAGEAGEVADYVKKVVGHRHPLDREKMAKELGDVLWYLTILAQRFGFSLEEVARLNVEKLRKRYPEGFSPERSLHRAAEDG